MYDEIIDALRKAYDQSAAKRDQIEREGWRVRERHAFLDTLLQEEKRSLLEIGAGPGKDSEFFHENGLRVVATGSPPQMVQLCRDKGLEAHVMDFKSLDFGARQFDAIYALNCLLHVPKRDLHEVLAQIGGLLKPDGLFFMAVYGGQESEKVWEDDHHQPKRFFSFYTDEQLSKVVSTVFEILDFKRITPVNDSGGLHMQRLILRKT